MNVSLKSLSKCVYEHSVNQELDFSWEW